MAGMHGAVVHRGMSVNDWNGFELGGVMMPFTDRLRCVAGPGFSPYPTFNFDGQLRREVAGSRRHADDV